MVDRVLASCYATVNHDVVHIRMTPIQWFPDMVQWIFGNEETKLILLKYNVSYVIFNFKYHY